MRGVLAVTVTVFFCAMSMARSYSATKPDNNHKCVPGEFRCGEGNCVPNEWVCDGSKDCSDGSDEFEHPACAQTNPDDATECFLKETGAKGKKPWICDGKIDCPNGMDELTCTHPQFQCHDGMYVSLNSTCDGKMDCKDGSDEFDCDGSCASLNCDHNCLSSRDYRVGKCVCRSGFALQPDGRSCKPVDVLNVKRIVYPRRKSVSLPSIEANPLVEAVGDLINSLNGKLTGLRMELEEIASRLDRVSEGGDQGAALDEIKALKAEYNWRFDMHEARLNGKIDRIYKKLAGIEDEHNRGFKRLADMEANVAAGFKRLTEVEKHLASHRHNEKPSPIAYD